MRETLPGISEFPCDGKVWRVDWLGGIERNHQVPTEFTIQVIITPVTLGNINHIVPRSDINKDLKTIKIGVGQLPIVTIGSLWQNGNRLTETAGHRKVFESVNISDSTVQLIRSDALVNDAQRILRVEYHPIGRSGWPSMCLAIEWQDDPYGIILPVAELIRFYYASSTDLAKAIFSGDFNHNLNSIVNPSYCRFDEQEKRCFLKLRREFSNNDGYIIGRILNSREAFAGATQVHDSMLLDATKNMLCAYPKSSFPFKGSTTLTARIRTMASPFNEIRYIIFALQYCTGDFPYKAITCDRDNNNTRSEEDINDQPDVPAYSTSRTSSKLSQDAKFQSEKEGSNFIQPVQVSQSENRFSALLGMQIDIPVKESMPYSNTCWARPLGLTTDKLGTSGGVYSDTLITPTSIGIINPRVPPLPANFDIFRRMVHYLTGLPGYQAAIRAPEFPIEFIPLTKPSYKRQWSYLDFRGKSRRRLIIAEIEFNNNAYCAIEFERRAAESFRIAIITTTTGVRLDSKPLSEILLLLANKEGRWENIDTLPPNIKLALLKHTWSSIDQFANAVVQKIQSINKI